MHYFVLSECNIRSGLSDVTAMCLGNFSWVSRFTINCQSSAEDNRFVFSLLFLYIFSPAFTKLICFNFFPGWWLLALIALITSFAITLSAWSWRQRYRPSPKAFGQLPRICCKDPFLAHSWQLGVSLSPHMYRFVGLGNTSYTALMRNRISLKKWPPATWSCNPFFLYILPPCPGSLLTQTDHFTVTHFFYALTDFFLDELASFFAFGTVSMRRGEKPQSRSAFSYRP